jgi:hypothetical protein
MVGFLPWFENPVIESFDLAVGITGPKSLLESLRGSPLWIDNQEKSVWSCNAPL